MRTEYVTRPREQIAAVLKREQRYLSAAEVFALLKKARTKVSLSTIYRTLDMLESRGEASSRLDAGGETTYVACAPTHHHHAICKNCGRVEEIACEAIEHLAQDLADHHGFALDDHAMEFFGRCSSCK
ncbi:MAG TPA: transcriptional repressor [Candidatus Baltobacteraceae bacterium]|jgi:Fur family ferric uptake transcriptional regulator|nr:transcriptional repressor [Candidatus Baltobacteraceae bacterium]